MSPELVAEIAAFRQAHPTIHYVDLLALDLSGHFYGKRYPITMLDKLAVDGTLRLPQNCILLGQRGQVYPIKHYVYNDGDPDAARRLIPGTLAPVPWSREPLAQMLVSTDGLPGAVPFEPREVLRQAVQRFRANGWRLCVAFELEFYLFDAQLAHGKPQFPVAQNSVYADQFSCMDIDRVNRFSDVLHAICRAAEQQQIRTTIISPELGPGQYEINFEHDHDPLRAADQSALFMRIVRGVAEQHGLAASFMPKPYLDHPGSGLHLHVSVYDEQGNNLFAENDNQKLKQAIAGCLHTAQAATLIFAPHHNAMRRYGNGAGNAASTIAWGWDHRGASIRIPHSDAKNRRLEHRLAGADANPYLVLAAVIAGIEHGLTQNPTLIASLNDDPHSGYPLPGSVEAAQQAFVQSAVLKTLLGNEFQQVYGELRRCDHQQFLNEISAREYTWFL